MSENAHHTNYVKIWGILVVLLIVSVIGPMAEIQWLTLLTAFGIACVKAYLVAMKFMHLGEMPKFITYIVVTCLVFMLLFYAGTAPDVYAKEGQNWVKPTWIAGTENDWVTVGAHHDDHGESGDHGAPEAEHH